MSPAPVPSTASISAFEGMFREQSEDLWKSVAKLLTGHGSMAPAVVQVVTKLSGGADAYSLTLGATPDLLDHFEAQARVFTDPGSGRKYTLLASQGAVSEQQVELSDRSVAIPQVNNPHFGEPWTGDFSAAVEAVEISRWMAAMKEAFPGYGHFVYRVPYTQKSGISCDSGAVFVMFGGEPDAKEAEHRARCRHELETKLGERSAQCLISILFECWKGLSPPSTRGDEFFKAAIGGHFALLEHCGRLLIVGERGSGKTWLAEQVQVNLKRGNGAIFDCSDAVSSKRVEELLEKTRRADLYAYCSVVLECVGQLSRQGQENLRQALYERMSGQDNRLPLFICTDAPVLPFRCSRGDFDAALLQLLEYNAVHLRPFRQWPMEWIDRWTQSSSSRWGWRCDTKWMALQPDVKKAHLARATQDGVDDLWGFQVYLTRHLKEAGNHGA